MSNKLKRMSKPAKQKTQKQAKAPMKETIQSMAAKKSLVQSNPKLTVFVLAATYFLLDYVMMDAAEQTPMWLSVIFFLLASSTLFSFYVNDYQRGLGPRDGTDVPKFIKNKQKYTTMGWFIITAWGILFLIIEPIVVPRFFKVLDETYHQSQIILMLLIAPIMEEITFRYLLYDRWLRKKLGWLGGFLVASLIFVMFHPVINTHALIIYWVPTVLFFLIYHEFGLYGAMLMHMIYNMMAI